MNKDGIPTGLGISKKGKKFRMDIVVCGVRIAESFDTLEEAIKTRNDLFDEAKKGENEALMTKEIVRNEKGEAVIHLKDTDGNISDTIIVDDDKWHELSKYGWHKIHNTNTIRATINTKSVTLSRFLYPNVGSDDRMIHINRDVKDYRIANLKPGSDAEHSHVTSKECTAL